MGEVVEAVGIGQPIDAGSDWFSWFPMSHASQLNSFVVRAECTFDAARFSMSLAETRELVTRPQPPGGKFRNAVNITDLAQRAGISKGAASLALRNRPGVSAETCERVQALARQHGYVPDPTVARVMSAVARKRPNSSTAPLAILSLWPQNRAWDSRTATLRRFHDGLIARAKERGFATEDFWLGSRGMTPRRMQQILVSRGIEGLIVLNYPRAPAVLEMDVSPFACAVIGRALIRPRLYSTDHDHQQGLYQVMHQVQEAGYRRPGLLLQADAHERTMHSWAAAYQFYSSSHPGLGKVPLVIYDNGPRDEQLASEARKLKRWFRRYRPDVIIAVQWTDLALLQAAGISVPEDVGFACLFWQDAKHACAGLDLQDEIFAACAVDLVVEQLNQSRRGIPLVPETVLFPGVWRDGPSLPWRTKRGRGL